MGRAAAADMNLHVHACILDGLNSISEHSHSCSHRALQRVSWPLSVEVPSCGYPALLPCTGERLRGSWWSCYASGLSEPALCKYFRNDWRTMELDQAAAVPVRRSTVGKALLPPHEHPGLLVVECNVRWREDRCDDIPKHVGTMPHFPAMSSLSHSSARSRYLSRPCAAQVSLLLI